MNLTMTVLPHRMAICRFAKHSWPAPWWLSSDFLSLTVSEDELSIMCEESSVPKNLDKCERGWRVLKVTGPLDFGLVGILAKLATVLAEANIPIVSISTHDTDHIMVREVNLHHAIDSLKKAGIIVK
jgi:hypothetical protein